MLPDNSHPLAALRSGVSLLAHSDPDSESMDPQGDARQGGAAARPGADDRHRAGAPARGRGAGRAARPELPPATNFLWMLFGKEPDELTAHAMDVAFILHAEHEFNASSFAARVAAGTYVDLHSSMTAAIATLKGPRHGGANEDVIEMIEEIGSPDKAEAWARDRLQRYLSASREERARPELRFPGMGHAVYKTWDPRARILQKLAGEVAERVGEGWIAEIQEKVRDVAAEGLGLNPNVDYYSAGLYHSLGIPPGPVHQHLRHARARPGTWRTSKSSSRVADLIRPRGEYTGPRGAQGGAARPALAVRVGSRLAARGADVGVHLGALADRR